MRLKLNGNHCRLVDITFVYHVVNFIPWHFHAFSRLLEAIDLWMHHMHGAIQDFAVHGRWLLYLLCHRLSQTRDNK